MSAFKLRQEKEGAYLLDGRSGQAFQLPEPAFNLLVALKASVGSADRKPAETIACYFPSDVENGRFWLERLERLGLTSADTLAALDVIHLDEPDTRVPDDCLAAPARIYFELTRRCNLACRTCFNNSHLPLPDELSTTEIMDALAQLNTLGTFEIRFTGGEPTEHSHFRELVAFARACGFYISLGTNGVYTEEKREWIYDAGIDWFIISLDGSEEVNDRVRGRGTYRQVRRTLQDLAARSHPHVRLNMVVGRHNVGMIQEVANLADEYNVESLNMIPLRPYGRSVGMMMQSMFSQSDFYAFIRLLQDLRRRCRVKFVTTLDLLDPVATTSHDPIVQKKKTCAAGVEAAVIGATGLMYGCSYSPASFPDSEDADGLHMFVAGNIRREPIKKIWRDSKLWAVFRYLDTYKNQRCHACPHYAVRCVGSCPIMGYFQERQPDASDPYCFVDLVSRTQTG